MAISTNKYYSLIASLPRLKKEFSSGVRLPIDRETFFYRLEDLKENDKKEMEVLFEHTKKIHEPMKWSDQDIIELYEDTYSKLKHKFLKDLIISGLTLRLALFVFRKRKIGEKPLLPSSKLPIIENIIKYISNNVGESDLKLSSRIKNISKINEAVNGSDILKAEKIIDESKWELAEKIGEGEFFTFKTLISYFMKWDIIYRWSRVNKDTGIIGFEKVLGEVQRYEF